MMRKVYISHFDGYKLEDDILDRCEKIQNAHHY